MNADTAALTIRPIGPGDRAAWSAPAGGRWSARCASRTLRTTPGTEAVAACALPARLQNSEDLAR